MIIEGFNGITASGRLVVGLVSGVEGGKKGGRVERKMRCVRGDGRVEGRDGLEGRRVLKREGMTSLGKHGLSCGRMEGGK